MAGGGLAAPYFIPNLLSAPRGNKLRLASFGGAGAAYATLDSIATHPDVTLVCTADVDSSRLDKLKQKYPDATVYTDWRQMLDKEQGNLDIACIGTPDHMHAPQAMSAMQAGLHVYVQKPLAHDIYEVRQLTKLARKKNLVTQMGIQDHSKAENRVTVQLVRSGAIGNIKEVHSWSGKKWGDLDPMPDRSDPVPPTLEWDLWLGVAAPRPYMSRYYHPLEWRKRVDFGTATLGDMGCHIIDPVFQALKLTAPLSIHSEGRPPSQHSWAINSVIRYVFQPTQFTGGQTVNIYWYDGDERPPKEIRTLVGSKELPTQGSIVIGSKGLMLLPLSGMPVLFPEEEFRDFAMPKAEDTNHYLEFVDAVLGKVKASAPFEYSGPLTEAVLLGPLATRFPKTTLEWNAAKMTFRNSVEASRYVRRKYRAGWMVKGLS